ncbi:Chaperone DnaJ domain protein [Melia azedarach]|uniref:Chaperone DnaJ domain protein n=1 Tax=Melia azedarach TaxID=155640 RepID=A0ACC1YXJ3_MELAZ|nr:Chaperone DnaJ domain protein [Melia azedarach]
MQGDEARVLLGFPPNSRPTASQVKAAYKRKVWDSHPDLFPVDKKTDAEFKFKLISEAYTCLLSGARGEGPASATNMHVVRTGVPMANGGRRNHALIRIPLLFIILGTVGLGGFNAARAYRKQKEAYPSHNPFLP